MGKTLLPDLKFSCFM